MKHKIPHRLDPPKARAATDKAFDAYRERFSDFNPTATWTTDDRAEIAFSAKGITLSGAVELKPDVIELELEVPFLFRPFKNKALSIIEEQIQHWIGKAEAGELDE
ncbi:MAG: hypothetical protein ACJA1R_001673 [Flavobacteriales bacterium]|jgi:hypothetical protein